MPRRSRRIEARGLPKDDEEEASPLPEPVETAPESAAPGSTVIPAETDYILGRGLAHVAHPGNAHMHDMLESYLHQYTSSSSKFAKTKIVRQIYGKLKVKGRFIDKRKNSETYYVVDAATARDKISHGIRYRRRVKANKATSSSSPSSEKSESSPVSETSANLSESSDNTPRESSDNARAGSDNARDSSDSAEEAASGQVQAPVPSFSVGSGSLNSNASWSSSHHAAAGQGAGRERTEIEGTGLMGGADEGISVGSGSLNSHAPWSSSHHAAGREQVEIEGMGLMGGEDEGSIASGLFSVQTLATIFQADSSLFAQRFSFSDSLPDERRS